MNNSIDAKEVELVDDVGIQPNPATREADDNPWLMEMIITL